MGPPTPPCQPIREFLVLAREFELMQHGWKVVVGFAVFLFIYKHGWPRLFKRRGGDP